MLACLVGGGADHTALGRVPVAADHDRAPAQLRMPQHLDRGDELVQVNVQHPLRPRAPGFLVLHWQHSPTTTQPRLTSHLRRSPPDPGSCPLRQDVGTGLDTARVGRATAKERGRDEHGGRT